jgi:hypothetical protein
MKKATLAYEDLTALLEVTKQLIEVVDNNVHKRLPKRLSATLVKRATEARNRVLQDLKDHPR